MDSKPWAIVPARMGSQGIPLKNCTPLDGLPPWLRARECARQAGIADRYVAISTDDPNTITVQWLAHGTGGELSTIERPQELATDSSPMISVVQHAIEQIPGPPEQIILLVQPTQVLRKPSHLLAAIELLETSGADSVVSVVQLPLTHSPDVVFRMNYGRLEPWDTFERGGVTHAIEAMPTRRQDAEPAYIRDGTVYAFRRSTIEKYGTLYGRDARPLVIPASESCALDEMEDWYRAERLLREREASSNTGR